LRRFAGAPQGINFRDAQPKRRAASFNNDPMRESWQLGDQIEGRWEVFKILQGGAGVVYIVYDHAFRESFAAKTFRPEIFASSPRIADRFIQESMAWLRLDIHPNITQARMFEKVEGIPYLFLEYVSGGDLGGWIGTPRLTEDLPQVLRFAIQFCDGMTHANMKGIRAHRDIKPRNCLITRDGVLKVTDFGLAKLLENETLEAMSGDAPRGLKAHLTATTVGTCTHMAPEQFINAGSVGLKADVYSFGVMLHQMVAGHLPFEGETWKDLEIMHKTQQPPLLKTTDSKLAELIYRCMAKKPDERFADFSEIRERLSEIYQRLTGSAPSMPAQGAALTAGSWNNKGCSLDNLGLHREALDCYNSAIELDPSLASAWFNKGVALFATGEPGLALECYERALKLNPKSEQAWSNKGVALKQLGKITMAIECYDRSLKINRRYPNAWVNKGVALRTMGKTDEALECYTRALALNPNDENSWSNKGNVLYSRQQIDEALVCYDRALEINPKLDRTWLNKGMALNALGRNEEAVACFEKAIELNPLLDQAWYLRGVTLMNVFQRIPDAVRSFEEAKRLGSKDAIRALDLCKEALKQA